MRPKTGHHELRMVTATTSMARPKVSAIRAVDQHGEPYIVREAARTDAARLARTSGVLVTQTPFMLKCGGDPLPSSEQERLLITFSAQSLNWLVLLAARPRGPLKRDEIIGSLKLTGGRAGRTLHTAQLGMGVVREHWGCGVGGALLDCAIQWAKANIALRRLSLQVYEDNEPARTLYRSRGFLDEGLMMNDVRDGARGIHLMGMGLNVHKVDQ